MEKILSADDFLNNYNEEYCAGQVYGSFGYPRTEVTKAMIDFAKLHVEVAQETIKEAIIQSTRPNCSDHTPFWGVCVSCGSYDNPVTLPSPEEVERLILESYSLDNIK